MSAWQRQNINTHNIYSYIDIVVSSGELRFTKLGLWWKKQRLSISAATYVYLRTFEICEIVDFYKNIDTHYIYSYTEVSLGELHFTKFGLA